MVFCGYFISTGVNDETIKSIENIMLILGFPILSVNKSQGNHHWFIQCVKEF